jgi:polar amino acid transport system substrate-binding protein
MVERDTILVLAIPVVALLFEVIKWLVPQPNDVSPFKAASRRRKALIVITSILMISALSYYSIRNVVPSELNISPVARIKSRGILVVGVKYSSPPFGYKRSETDPVQGFEPEIGREIARAIFNDASKVRFVKTERGDRISPQYLQENEIDIVISTVSINYEADNRQQTMAFSDPYYIAGQRLLVRKGYGATNLPEFSGRAVCVGSGENEANLKAAIPEVVARPVENTRSCLSDLRTGSIDAISSDEFITLQMLQQYDDLELQVQPLTSDPYGIAVSKSTKQYGDLVTFLNATLSNLKREGRWRHLYESYIG